MYSHDLVKKLNEIAHRFMPIIYKSIHDVISQPKFTNTGAGAASLKVDVVDGNANQSPQILITFDDRLIYLNKSKMQWTKLGIKGLLEWASTKRSDPKQAKQLAWATAWNQKKYDTWKPKLWRKKSLSQVLKDMNKMILEGFDKAIEEEFEHAANTN